MSESDSTDVEFMRNALRRAKAAGSRGAGRLLELKVRRIDDAISAILILNTLANTLGATLAGAQAAHVFGQTAVGVFSGVLTLLILVFSEIIPKTLGAVYVRTLSPPVGWLLALLVRHPNLIEDMRDADPQFFRHTENQQLFTELLACPTIEELRDGLDPVLNGLLDRLEGEEFPPLSSSERELARDRCLSRLEDRHLRELQMSLVQTEAPHVAPQREVGARIQEVNQRIRELESIRSG